MDFPQALKWVIPYINIWEKVEPKLFEKLITKPLKIEMKGIYIYTYIHTQTHTHTHTHTHTNTHTYVGVTH